MSPSSAELQGVSAQSKNQEDSLLGGFNLHFFIPGNAVRLEAGETTAAAADCSSSFSGGFQPKTKAPRSSSECRAHVALASSEGHMSPALWSHAAAKLGPLFTVCLFLSYCDLTGRLGHGQLVIRKL